MYRTMHEAGERGLLTDLRDGDSQRRHKIRSSARFCRPLPSNKATEQFFATKPKQHENESC